MQNSTDSPKNCLELGCLCFNISFSPPTGTPSQEEVTPQEPEAPAGAPKKGLKMSYDEYKQMANLMVLYMRKQEEETDGEWSSR